LQEGPSEYEEVERELGSKTLKVSTNGQDLPKDKGSTLFLRRIFSPILLEAFVLTFLAEWGDRSQVEPVSA
jgi:putative Ca2+/H+ antiporter (TMEM165/GDT1 family)